MPHRYCAVCPCWRLPPTIPDWAYPVTPRDRLPPDSRHSRSSAREAANSTRRRRSTTVQSAGLVSRRASADAGGRRQGDAARRPRLRAMPSDVGQRPSGIVRAWRAYLRNYIVRQMAAFKNGERKGIRAAIMIAMAKVITDDEVRAAAGVFRGAEASFGLQQGDRNRHGPEELRRRRRHALYLGDGGVEPIGTRIIVMPQNRRARDAARPEIGLHRLRPEGQHRQRRGVDGRRRRQNGLLARSATDRRSRDSARCLASSAARRPIFSASSTT